MTESAGPSSLLPALNAFKLVLLGEGAVGKSSILLRYTQNKFIENHESTIQVSFLIKFFILPLDFRQLLPPKRFTLMATKLN